MLPPNTRPDWQVTMGGKFPLFAVEGINHRFAGALVIEDFSLKVDAQELVVLLAPSGAGKSTLLKIALGAVMPTSGIVNRRVLGTEISLVTQEDSILPWLTVRENVAFVGKFSGRKDQENVADILDRFGLLPFAEYYPRAISGGMTQLVAMCRALSINAELYILDEAIAHMDEIYKTAIITELRKRVNVDGAGALVVTQNPAEALLLADRIVIGRSRPLRNVQELISKLPPDRDASIVHTDAFGEQLMELRKCLHALWT